MANTTHRRGVPVGCRRCGAGGGCRQSDDGYRSAEAANQDRPDRRRPRPRQQARRSTAQSADYEVVGIVEPDAELRKRAEAQAGVSRTCRG